MGKVFFISWLYKLTSSKYLLFFFLYSKISIAFIDTSPYFSTISSFFSEFKKTNLSQSKESKNSKIIMFYSELLSCKNISPTLVQALLILLLIEKVYLS